MKKEVSWILAPYIRVGLQKKILYIGFGSIQKEYSDEILQKAFLKALGLFLEPMSIEEAYKILLEQEIQKDVAQEVIEQISNGFLIPEDFYNPSDRHSRSQLFYALSGAEAPITQN